MNGIRSTQWISLESLRVSPLWLALGMVAVSGCAHVRSDSSGKDVANNGPRTVTEVIQQNGDSSSSKSASNFKPTPVQNPSDISVFGMKLKNTQFDYPITVNSRVEYWISYFCGKGRKHFEKYLDRSEFFIPYIHPILKQSGLPEDLVYLAMIESGFNNFARSQAKAVGPWQFISATGKRYGLMVNWWVDERRDIRKATLAAVEYLRELYGMFGSWELAAAAYNAGEGKIARGIQRYGTTDFWALSKHKFLRQETRDYVPKIIAAAIISKNRSMFGFQDSAAVHHPDADEAVAGDGEVVKVIKTDKPEEQVETKGGNEDDENVGDLLGKLAESAKNDPEFSGDGEDSAPTVTPATLLVPVDGGTFQEGTQVNNQNGNSGSGDSMPLAKPVPTPHMTKDGQVGGAELAEFDVKSPADLLKVARAAGLSYQTVKSLNPELLRWCTPPNVGSYRLRLPASVKEKFLVTYNHVAFPRQVKFMTYKIRRGETISHVAHHFGIKVDPISDLNGVSPKARLRNGIQVLLPMPNDRSRSLASLEVRDPPEKKSRRHRRRGSPKYTKISYKNREAARAPQSTRRRGG